MANEQTKNNNLLFFFRHQTQQVLAGFQFVMSNTVINSMINVYL